MSATTRRLLRRSGREMPPLLWEWTGSPDPAVLQELRRISTTWVYFPEAASAPIAMPDLNIVLGVPADALQPRRGAIVHDRLRALGVSRCTAVMLQDVSAGAIKAGGPFHRLSQLRDQGTIDLFFAEADDYATAEWLLHHTPAHALSLPFSLGDLTPKYRLLRDAVGFGTGIVARPSQSIWNAPQPPDLATTVSFLAAEEAVTSILLPLPRRVEELHGIANALEHPMPEPDRARWWDSFQQQIPEPPPPPRGIAPDLA